MSDEQLGPTGEYPDGKLGPGDEGELVLEVSSGPGIVKIDFGTKVRWIALPPEDALNFSMMIAGHAGKARAAFEDKQSLKILGPDGAPPNE